MGASMDGIPLSGKNGTVMWRCGCETGLVRGEPIPAGCPKHDAQRVRENKPWSFNFACRLYTDEHGRVWITDSNGDGRVAFDPQIDNDFDNMMEIIEAGMLHELERREEKGS